jgi:hypothetical protein
MTGEEDKLGKTGAGYKMGGRERERQVLKMGEGGKLGSRERDATWEEREGWKYCTVREAWQSFKGGSQTVKEREASVREGRKL